MAPDSSELSTQFAVLLLHTGTLLRYSHSDDVLLRICAKPHQITGGGIYFRKHYNGVCLIF